MPKHKRSSARDYNIWASRSGIFYFRALTPRWARDCCPTLPKEIRRSLGTNNPREALKLVRPWQVAFATLLERIKTEMGNGSKRPTDELLFSYITLSNLSVGSFSAEKIQIDTGDPEQDRITALALLNGAKAVNGSTLPSVAQESSEKLLLSELGAKYLEDRKGRELVNEKTLSEYQSAINLFIKITGDRPVSDLKIELFDDYVKTLMRLPPNMSKKYPGYSIRQVLDAKPARTMHRTTIRKSVTQISQMFNWAVQRGLMTRNVASNQPLPKAKLDHESRDAYEPADLQLLFTELCREHVDHPYKYWLPLLGLFTGARQQELAQLYVRDIECKDEVWLIHICKREGENDKKLKTESARRTIPIHDTLIEIGFLEFYKRQLGRKQLRLFSDLAGGANGYGSLVSKWFNNTFLPKTGIRKSGGKKDFHSFRHTFVNALKQIGRTETEIGEIVGHKNTSITFKRYAKPFEAGLKRGIVNSAKFEIPLDALKEKWKHMIR